MARTPQTSGKSSEPTPAAATNKNTASANKVVKNKKMPKKNTPHPRAAAQPAAGAQGPQLPAPAARRSPSPQPGASPWSTPVGKIPTATPSATPAREAKPKPALFGVSRSPHSSFDVDEILGKALTCQKSPMTNKAELQLHEELSRTPCAIISEFAKKDKLHAMGCRWDKELKTWTSSNINIVREHRNVVIFTDGFIPPRDWNTERSANGYYLPGPRYFATQFTPNMLRYIDVPLTNSYKDQIDSWLAEHAPQ